MWDAVGKVAGWAMVAFLGVQVLVFIGLMLWSAWREAIRPRLISAGDIARVTDSIIAGYADPEEEAFARHEAAWHRSDGAEIAYWYRVRKAVRRRLGRR